MLGTPLFERHAGGADLTAAGSIFLERVQVITLEYEHALQNVADALAEQTASIRLGAGPVWSSAVMPLVATRFHKLFPDHRLHVHTGPAQDLVEELRLGRIELYAGALVESQIPKGFVRKVIAQNEMSILAARTHPLALRGGPLSPTALSEYPFVVYAPSRDVLVNLSAWLRERSAPPARFMVEANSLLGCMEMVRQGHYLFYESRMLTQFGIGRDLAVLPMGEPVKPFDTGFLYREQIERLPHYARLMRIMIEVLHCASHEGTP
jgi:DNA-binding transcriptional LysR family regulator